MISHFYQIAPAGSETDTIVRIGAAIQGGTQAIQFGDYQSGEFRMASQIRGSTSTTSRRRLLQNSPNPGNVIQILSDSTDVGGDLGVNGTISTSTLTVEKNATFYSSVIMGTLLHAI